MDTDHTQATQTDPTEQPPKPTPLPFRADGLPLELRETGRFCCWNYELKQNKSGVGRWTKVPCHPRTGQHIRSTEPGDFCAFDYAETACKLRGYDGVGVGIFGNLCGIDVDHCLTRTEAGGVKIDKRAVDIQKIMDSYTEFSPSGTGIRILFETSDDFIRDYSKDKYRVNKDGIEIYIAGKTNRFLTVTGRYLPNSSGYVRERSAQAREVLDKYMKREPEPTQPDTMQEGTETPPDTMQTPSARSSHASGTRMTRKEAIAEVKRAVPVTRYLTPSKDGFYCCPLCGSGTMAHHTGAMKYYSDKNTAYCHSCGNEKNGGKSLDCISAHMITHNCEFSEALADLCKECGIDIIPDDTETPSEPRRATQTAASADSGTSTPPTDKSQAETSETSQTANRDFSNYYKECQARIEDPRAVFYLTERGISLETAKGSYIGFDPEADPACNPGGTGASKHPVPRIIAPVGGTDYYVARSTDPDTPAKYKKMISRGSKPRPSFMGEVWAAAEKGKPCFIVEGCFDALSLLEAGQEVVSLNSTSVVETFLQILDDDIKDGMQIATLIICLDGDAPGREAQAKFVQELRKRPGVDFIEANIHGPYKDANDYLKADREGFFLSVRKAVQQAGSKPDNVGTYIDNFLADEVAEFRSDILTGFENLDKECDKLYAGLYVVAAISSLGKTTFVHQMADQIATMGHDVLYFSLEQSRLEMVTKSLSRLTAQEDFSTAVSSVSIRKGYLTPAVLAAKDRYKKRVGDRLSVVEGNFDCSVQTIEDYTRRYIKENNVTPVVIVDYLQILEPMETKYHLTTKEATDQTVTQIKRLSRDLNAVIICICSVNRANYLTPIDFESLKESGSIEYSADVVWGLQLHCLDADPLFGKESKITAKRERIKQAKAENPRQIDLKCLKNRFGKSSYTCSFKYYPIFDLFVPADDFQPQQAGGGITV